jgi:hypothetical protein
MLATRGAYHLDEKCVSFSVLFNKVTATTNPIHASGRDIRTARHPFSTIIEQRKKK